MAASEGQEHINFLKAMEVTLGQATDHQKLITDSPQQLKKFEENKPHVRAAMLYLTYGYLEVLLPPPVHFHQRGYKERELTVWRAIRNALVHNGGDLRVTTSPPNAEQITQEFLADVQNGTEVDTDGSNPGRIGAYYDVDSNGIVTLIDEIFFRARKVAFHLLVHTGHIVR